MSKTIFITGASRGLGKIWTEAFLKRGDNVIAAVRNLESLNDLSAEYPSTLKVVKLDITDRESCFKVVKEAKSYFGKIDVLINNAGYGHIGAIEELTESEVRAQIETNLFGLIWVTQAILPIMREQGFGHLIQVSSALGTAVLPTMGIYSASKFAVEGLNETLALEVKNQGIKVTILEPNGFATDFSVSSFAQSTPLPIYDNVRQTIGARQGARTEDVGDPQATAKAILTLVDAEEPPLRLILGKAALPWFKTTYEERLKTWEDWQHISVPAHGN
ncbi:SDR family NAD(P)-dependent oxidoreductase [Chryseobacterium sp. MYb264]|uniref:SDR family NAD(P)-dependent oxidoreductase n=1 Tax=Chryseobacterium sp. MYb264 TaxID=2745153 RepID=UPI002E114C75|nr:SDR family NAD(P)-dependent oxidoreductase [Chryseobacterium sp. MYb264]